MRMEIRVPIDERLDVPFFFKDIPNFVKYVPRLLKSVLRWGTTSNHFPKIPKGINGPWVRRWGSW